MKPIMRSCQTADDFFRIRNFLRGALLLNDRLEHSWNVARLDYWRWHYILTCNIWESVATGLLLWEMTDGNIVAVLTDIGGGELRLHVHPQFRSRELEDEMLADAEDQRMTIERALALATESVLSG